jgi:RNA polymerase sigma-70 factor (ECF subfamily)
MNGQPGEAPASGHAGSGPDLGAALAGAQQGNADSFRELYRDCQPRLLRYLGVVVGDDAEDVAAEAWLQVARDFATFQGDYDGFRGWVATIARHRALDHLRRGNRRPPPVLVPAEELSGLPAADDTAARALESVSTQAAIRLIAKLPPDQAEAVMLRAVVGLDADSAGRVLGKRAGAVRTAAYRGLRTLARHLEQGADVEVAALARTAPASRRRADPAISAWGASEGR